MISTVQTTAKSHPAANVSVKTQQEIQHNADYGGRADETLSAAEVEAMHQQVMAKLATTSGDASECVVSARQLALLLAAAIHGTNSEG